MRRLSIHPKMGSAPRGVSPHGHGHGAQIIPGWLGGGGGGGQRRSGSERTCPQLLLVNQGQSQGQDQSRGQTHCHCHKHRN